MRLALIPCLLLLASCAGMDAQDCRGADWYALGERDGRYGSQPQVEVYSGWCAAHGVQPDAARYAEGWSYGNSEYRVRKLD